MGAGALGSVYGGYLSQAGFDVTLVGRPPHMGAIAEEGLHVTGHDEFVAHPGVTSDASTVRQADLLLMCVRAPDTPQALEDVAHLRPDGRVRVLGQTGRRVLQAHTWRSVDISDRNRQRCRVVRRAADRQVIHLDRHVQHGIRLEVQDRTGDQE